MRIPTRTLLATLAGPAAALLIAGCASATPPATTGATAPASVTTAAVTSAPATSTPEQTPTAIANCPTGVYSITSLKATGLNGTIGSGTGGDLKVAFTDGKYRITGQGKEPVKLSIAGQSGSLFFDGSLDGTYSGAASGLTFAYTSGSGTVKLESNGKSQSLSIPQLAKVLAPTGKGSAECSAGTATVTGGGVTFDLSR